MRIPGFQDPLNLPGDLLLQLILRRRRSPIARAQTVYRADDKLPENTAADRGQHPDARESRTTGDPGSDRQHWAERGCAQQRQQRRRRRLTQAMTASPRGPNHPRPQASLHPPDLLAVTLQVSLSHSIHCRRNHDHRNDVPECAPELRSARVQRGPAHVKAWPCRMRAQTFILRSVRAGPRSSRTVLKTARA
jgi:hypothetical protein